MKKSYICLFIYEIIFTIILLLNSTFFNFLNNYIILLLLIVCIIIFAIIFGIERDRNYYSKNTTLEIIISLLIFFILYYLLGIITGFTKISNYYSIYGFKKFIIPNILFIILKEILRYSILKKSEKNKLLIISNLILFIFLDITNSIYYTDFTSSYNIFIYISTILLPTITNNILANYISVKVGYKPTICYLLMINLYKYLIPIIPNPNEYIYSLIFLILPMAILYRINKLFEMTKDEFKKRENNKGNTTSLIISFLIILFLGYFTSGYFKYYAIAIASGSMSPLIKKGDVVIVEKIKEENISKIKVGEILAFEYSDTIIVHRIVNIKKDNQGYYFYTKGDANSQNDKFIIKEDMIVGIVNVKIPYIGMPTVWLNEL